MDDVEIACDTATNLEAAGGGMYLGVIATTSSDRWYHFVRIYDVALSAEEIEALTQ